MTSGISIGMARMHVEAGERRDFLPEFVAHLENHGGRVVLENGYGSGMGYQEKDYRLSAPGVRFASHEEVYQQDYVIVLRCPSDEDLKRLRPDACLISMLHYPTRPQRRAFLHSLGIEAISLDSIKDDSGRRLVENLRSVAWNGMEVAFQTLQTLYPSPGFESPERATLHVTLLGSGAVGTHVVQAAIRYADNELWQDLASRGVPGVQVTVVDYDTTSIEKIMLPILARTDILVDATQRPDPSRPVIPNSWIGYMPSHAVLLDLSVDPYICDSNKLIVKGIEGIPQGNLDQYIFRPDDPAYERVPECVQAKNRRFAVSCYSWPGIHPVKCMRVYGRQLRPLLRTLIEKGGSQNIEARGRFFVRALSRAMLSRWVGR
jgi:alanine dehydrogenase